MSWGSGAGIEEPPIFEPFDEVIGPEEPPLPASRGRGRDARTPPPRAPATAEETRFHTEDPLLKVMVSASVEAPQKEVDG